MPALSEEEKEEYKEEVEHYDRQHPKERGYTKPKGRVERATRAVGAFRDDVYGYERVKTGKNKGAVRSNHVGEVNFFPARQSSLITMDPFHIGGSAPARSVKGSKRNTRSSDPFYIPDSMAWMF